MTRLVRSLAAAACLLLPAAMPAQLVGSTLGLQALYPDLATVDEELGTAVVGAGLEFTTSFDETVDVYDAGFTYTLLDDLDYFGADFSGLRLYDPGSLAPDFAGVTILSATGIFAGFAASRLTFDAANIYINMADLSGSGSLTVAVATTATVVPEPATLALVATGLAAVAAARRRRAG